MTQHECTVYKCDYCRKKYLVRHACLRHEKYCPKNPKNLHACFSCPHLEKGTEVTDEGMPIVTFTCNKLDKQLHSFVAERIGHVSVGDTERMPLDCHAHPDSIRMSERVTAVLEGKPDPGFIDFEF